MIVLVDNYDSFTFNLVHYLGGLGADVAVHRNDKIAVADVLALQPDAPVLSPRPPPPPPPQRGRHPPRPHREGLAHGSNPRRLPRPPGGRPGVRRQGGARAAAG